MIRPLHLLFILVIDVIWAFNTLAIKYAVEAVDPVTAVFLRYVREALGTTVVGDALVDLFRSAPPGVVARFLSERASPLEARARLLFPACRQCHSTAPARRVGLTAIGLSL